MAPPQFLARSLAVICGCCGLLWLPLPLLVWVCAAIFGLSGRIAFGLMVGIGLIGGVGFVVALVMARRAWQPVVPKDLVGAGCFIALSIGVAPPLFVLTPGLWMFFIRLLVAGLCLGWFTHHLAQRLGLRAPAAPPHQPAEW